MTSGPLVVTYDVAEKGRTIIAEALAGAAEVIYLGEADDGARSDALRKASVLLARNTGKDLRPGEANLLMNVRLIQFMSAGVDFIPLGDLPPEVPIAANGGAYAEPMAEHALAMALAAAKRLLVEHRNLAQGEFNQFTSNRMLSGGVCGVFGFGGIGVATARLMRGLGMRIHAVNRRGAADEPIDWIGTSDRLDELLAASDVFVICAPLTRATERRIGSRALSLMKEDAILINLARGEIIDETALYKYLLSNPRFTACLDAWWFEPVRHGTFRVGHPFLDLPNVIGSPHNSASVRGWQEVALRRAAANCRRALIGETPHHVVGPDDRMM